MIFALIALLSVFFKLPGLQELVHLPTCSSCMLSTPYLPMLGAGYFATLLSVRLSFPTLPPPWLRIGGITWALGLGVGLTLLNPAWCLPCLIAHTSHLAFWIFWNPKQRGKENMVGMKLSLAFTALIASMALLSTLHFTLLVYGLTPQRPALVKAGKQILPFESEKLALEGLAQYKGVVLNFVSSQCPFCEEQLPKLEQLARQLPQKAFRFVSIAPRLTDELRALAISLEWTEDPRGELASLFGISGYPTAILLDREGVVVQTFVGASGGLEEALKKRAETVEKEN